MADYAPDGDIDAASFEAKLLAGLIYWDDLDFTGCMCGEIPGQQGQINQTIRMQRILDYLSQLSVQDPLTGLFNRRFFERTFDAELERASREQRPVTLAIIDIDHFKHVNDHWGHDAGDEVLRRITRSMLAVIRISDVLARVGGEEFALIMPGIRQVEARRAMQRLRIGIEQMTIPVEDEQLRVTVSIGMAVRDRAQLFSAEVLYKQADEALYRAKQAGRNRVELYEIPATEGLTPEERDALLR